MTPELSILNHQIICYSYKLIQIFKNTIIRITYSTKFDQIFSYQHFDDPTGSHKAIGNVTTICTSSNLRYRKDNYKISCNSIRYSRNFYGIQRKLTPPCGVSTVKQNCSMY